MNSFGHRYRNSCFYCTNVGINHIDHRKNTFNNYFSCRINNLFFQPIPDFSLTGRIVERYGVIATICEHIVTENVAIRIDVAVRIEKSSPFGIVVSRLEVIVPRLDVVVITSVTEGIILVRHKEVIAVESRRNGHGTFAPRIICVGTDLPAVFVIDTDHIAEYIFVEEVIIKFAVFIFARAVLDTGRRTVLVIDEI